MVRTTSRAAVPAGVGARAGALGRPGLVALALVLVVTATQTSAHAEPRSSVVTKEEQAKISPADALERLKQGNQRFVAGESTEQDWLAQAKATVSGQFPYAIVLGCVDSRVPVEVVFDQGVGDIFTARVAGNIVTDEMLGSMEFATKVAGAKLVVVLGHTSCGAVKGACEDVQLGNILDLVEEIRPSVVAVTPEGKTCSSKDIALVNEIAAHNVKRMVDEIRQRSRILRDLEADGSIRIVGGMYDLASGKVTFYE